MTVNLMTVKQMLKRESRTMGRPVDLVDYAKLQGGLIVIIYDSTSQPLPKNDGGKHVLVETRFAISHNNEPHNIASGCVRSRWRDV